MQFRLLRDIVYKLSWKMIVNRGIIKNSGSNPLKTEELMNSSCYINVNMDLRTGMTNKMLHLTRETERKRGQRRKRQFDAVNH